MKKKEKKMEERICYLCGRTIFPEEKEEPVYIKTKRRTEIWIHRVCFRRGSNE